jgi:very-short-patch-repair endonuclease
MELGAHRRREADGACGMSTDWLVRGQRVAREKVERSKAFRKGMTPAESRLWTALRGKRLDGVRFRRQQIIDGFIVDFYCHAAGLVVEVDGSVHDEQAEYDAARDGILATRGIRILRFSNDAVMNDLTGVLDVIQAAIGQRAAAGE